MTELFGTATIEELYETAYLRGAASTFDLWGRTGRFYRFAQTAEEANARAIENNIEVLKNYAALISQRD